MSSGRSWFRRLAGAVWACVIGLYRLMVVLLVLMFVGGLVLALRGAAPKKLEDNVALVVYPSGDLVETLDEDPAQRLVQRIAGDPPRQTLLRDVTDALDKAAKDPRIPLAVLKLDSLDNAGLAQLQELGDAVQRFRAAGKPVYAYGPYYEQGPYLVAAQADHVSLDPLGMVILEGLGVYENYFKEGLDKLGVDVNVFRVGEYKSAVEPFERNGMSPEAREANRDWLTDLWSSYGRGIAKGRELGDDAVQDYVVGLPQALKAAGGDAATLAKDSRLVDTVETLPQFRARIAETVGWDEDHGSFRQIHFSDYLSAVGHEKRKLAHPGKTIALVVVQGEIADRESGPGVAGAETIADLLDAAREDESAVAVVLRVNSPGGSVFGSEHIRRGIQSLQADGKPVVVSMSDVAASGGYWVSMVADEIWAHDTTVTGSIGIFALWPTFNRPLEKLGIHSDGLGTSPLAGAFRGDRALPPEAAAVIQAQIEQGYRMFIDGVAEGRELPVEKVQDIARGRVWSGADAVKLGLVDQVGGLNDAVASAVRLAGLDPGDYRLEEYRPQREYPLVDSLLEFAAQALVRAQWPGLQGAAQGVLQLAAQPPLAQLATALRWMNDDPRGIYARCFCVPSVGGRRH
ncbi:MAG TPA: signal peptide peptidase SppA [Candidatus Binatia bacterium]|nr:signal peptide peptidase SppA [Candidatus Binatia bacterium]